MAVTRRAWLSCPAMSARIRVVDCILLSAIVAVLAAGWATGLLGGRWGYDAHAYWSVDLASPYARPVGSPDAFLYSPPVAMAFAALGRLPWPAFLVGWTALLAAALWLMCRPRAAMLALVPFVWWELGTGNIHLLLALAVVAGFRWPGAWAFLLLTKVTPGVGLLWFAARRDWRALGVALGTTAAIAGASLVVAPDLWRQWVELLAAAPSQAGQTWAGQFLGPLWVRLAMAAAIAILAGLAGWRWPIAIVLCLSIPVLWMVSLSCLVALVPLAAMDRRDPLPAMWPSWWPRRQSMTVMVMRWTGRA